jgi:hypothetical protein
MPAENLLNRLLIKPLADTLQNIPLSCGLTAFPEGRMQSAKVSFWILVFRILSIIIFCGKIAICSISDLE